MQGNNEYRVVYNLVNFKLEKMYKCRILMDDNGYVIVDNRNQFAFGTDCEVNQIMNIELILMKKLFIIYIL